VVLLTLFAAIEARVAHPLLPPRVVADRNRSASYLTIAFAAMAMFGTFLFLTYDLQGIKGYSPIRTGAAFLPMTLVLMATSIFGSTILRPRIGPRWLVTIGMTLGAVGMLYLTRLGVNSAYAVDILPTLLVEGIGLGLVFATATNSATFGVEQSDSGVASATANASQQVGGSLGTALLSTVAASATTSYLRGLNPTAAAITSAYVHGYTTAFAWSAAFFAVGAVIAAVLFTSGVPATESTPETEPAAELVLVR
jgi:predicted MFS family arabinose efflux permease